MRSIPGATSARDADCEPIARRRATAYGRGLRFGPHRLAVLRYVSELLGGSHAVEERSVVLGQILPLRIEDGLQRLFVRVESV